MVSSHGELLPGDGGQEEASGPEVLRVGARDIELPEGVPASDNGSTGSAPGADLEEDATKTPEERARNILSDFAAFHYERKLSGYLADSDILHPELNAAHFGLIIKAEEIDRALEFVEVLVENLIPGATWVTHPEYELNNTQALFDVADEFRENDLIVIFDCMEKPVLRTDDIGSCAAYDAVKKEIAEYERRWGVISECARQENAASLIVIASDIVYRTTLRYNTDIHDVVCDAHLWLKGLTLDQIYMLFMKELENSSFGKMLGENFETELKDYIRTVYPKSEIRGRNFLKAYLGKIYTKYILKGDYRNSLKGCIPANRMPSVNRILAQLKEKTGLGDVVPAGSHPPGFFPRL